MCAPSHRNEAIEGLESARQSLSRNQSSSLSHAAQFPRPHAEPKSKSRASASSSGSRDQFWSRVAQHEPHHHRLRCRANAVDASHGAAHFEGSRPDGPLLSCAGSAQSRATERDASHQQVVSGISFSVVYHLVLQGVAVTSRVSSIDRKPAGEHRWCLRQRGPDNGKPAERPGRKATRLPRRNVRHASRAAERYPRRSTQCV